MKLVLALFLCFVSALSSAKELDSFSDAQALSEQVMELVSQDKITEGLKLLKPYSVAPIAEFDVQLSNVDMQVPAIQQRFGKSIGYDFIAEEKLGDSFAQLIYLQKFEKHAMVWRFVFYKPKQKWLLNMWYFDDKIHTLFKK